MLQTAPKSIKKSFVEFVRMAVSKVSNLKPIKAYKKANKVKLLLAMFAGFFLSCAVLPYIIPLPQSGAQMYDAFKESQKSSGEFVSIDGYTTFVQDIGSKSGKVIVLIHGFGGSTFTWRNTALALADKGYRVISVDLKGFGNSEKILNTDYSHDVQAKLITKILQSKNISKATFIAHSMGVNVVLHLYKQSPNLVDKLVFVDGNNIQPGYALLNQVSSGFVGTGYGTQILRQVILRQFGKETIHNTLASAMYKDDLLTRDMEEGYALPTTIKGWEDSLIGVVRDSTANGVSDQEVAKINVKTLVIWGEKDEWIPLTRGREFAGLIGGSELVILPDCGHLAMEEYPTLFNALLVEYLKK